MDWTYLYILIFVIFLTLSLDENKVHAMSGSNVTLTVPKSSVQLQCLGDDTDDILSWYRNSSLVNYATNNNYVINNANGTLTIQSVGEMDVGQYVCVNQDNRQVNIYIFSPPVMTPLGKSVSATEGQSVSIQCHVWGWPVPQIIWTSGNTVQGPQQNPSVSFTPTTVMGNQTLYNGQLNIANLNLSNQMNYTCIGVNIYGSTNSTTLLRVHDRLAAIWPFLGILFIVVIVVIMTIVGGIVERKSKVV